MIITVAGLTGSGKNTLGELLSEKLGYKLVCPTFKDLAKAEGISLMEFQAKAEKDQNIDKKFDAVLKAQAKNGNCIVTTWLGPWMLDAEVRIKIFAPIKTRAERIAKRDGMTVLEAMKHIKERDYDNRKRYKKVYGIDIYDEDLFDLTINSGIYSPDKMLDIAMAAIDAKIKRK